LLSQSLGHVAGDGHVTSDGSARGFDITDSANHGGGQASDPFSKMFFDGGDGGGGASKSAPGPHHGGLLETSPHQNDPGVSAREVGVYGAGGGPTGNPLTADGVTGRSSAGFWSGGGGSGSLSGSNFGSEVFSAGSPYETSERSDGSTRRTSFSGPVGGSRVSLDGFGGGLWASPRSSRDRGHRGSSFDSGAAAEASAAGGGGGGFHRSSPLGVAASNAKLPVDLVEPPFAASGGRSSYSLF